MQSYLQKHAYGEALINELPAKDLKGIVVIPSFNEVDLLDSIHSLFECTQSNGLVEILPILNSPQSSDSAVNALHWNQYEAIQKFSKEKNSDLLRLHAIKPVVLPDKIAGVGLARKLGMDEAVRRFEFLSKDGIILNFDADCICSKDYLSSIFEFYDNNPDTQALSIGFRHRWDPMNEKQKQAIILYELHLRCYIGWQKFYQYPFAFQTLGSCFAVKSKAYQAQGGMNKRQAGEDFYFLHKFSVLGELTELNKILVYPSGRISHRVPFGTGKAVHDIINLEKKFQTYNPEAIRSFTQSMLKVSNSYDEYKRGVSYESHIISDSLSQYLMSNAFGQALQVALENSSNGRTFEKRISKWFDPFRLMKYLHFARETEFQDIDVFDSAKRLVELDCENHPLTKVRGK